MTAAQPVVGRVSTRAPTATRTPSTRRAVGRREIPSSATITHALSATDQARSSEYTAGFEARLTRTEPDRTATVSAPMPMASPRPIVRPLRSRWRTSRTSGAMAAANRSQAAIIIGAVKAVSGMEGETRRKGTLSSDGRMPK